MVLPPVVAYHTVLLFPTLSQSKHTQCIHNNLKLKGAAIEVLWEHDDSGAPGQPAFTWRLIDMPKRANRIWSQQTKNTSLKQRGGRLVLSQNETWSAPPPPRQNLGYC